MHSRANSLLLIPHAALHQAPATLEQSEVMTRRAMQFDTTLIMVYKESDFKFVANRAYAAWKYLLAFSFWLETKDAHRYQALCNVPEIASALAGR